MNKSAKRRLVVVGGIVVIAMLVIVAIAGSGGSASSLSIADVLGICTGTVDGNTLEASEMVTKCPSKYESAEGSLTVKGLLDQQDSMMF